jgi:hypothetical protein
MTVSKSVDSTAAKGPHTLDPSPLLIRGGFEKQLLYDGGFICSGDYYGSRYMAV